MQSDYVDGIAQVSCFIGGSRSINQKQTWKDNTGKSFLIKNLIMICLSMTPIVSTDHIIGKVQKKKQSLERSII